MSSFKSESSRLQAQGNVNKLLLNFLPGSEELVSQNTKKAKSLTSGALIVNQKISSKKNIHINEELNRRALRKEKLLRRKKIQENLLKTKELNQLVKIEKLKKAKKYEDEELQSIINSKLDDMRSWENTQQEDLKELEKEILLLTNKEHQKRKKIKLKNLKKMDFNRKLQKGLVAYPGLTPGLAPVDLTDDEDEDSD